MLEPAGGVRRRRHARDEAHATWVMHLMAGGALLPDAFGGDIELWLIRDSSSIDLSIGGGLHRTDIDGGGDVLGIDAFGILSGHLSDTVELYGSLNLDFERPDGLDDFTIAHGVAGLEIALSESLDVQLEGGAGLNDRSHDYLAVGLALYIR